MKRLYIYTKSQTIRKKQDNFRYAFIYKQLDTLRYTIFHETSEISICIQKSWQFALREFFIYKKLDTSQKARQFALRFFIYKKPDTLRCVIFMEFLKLAEGGGHLYMVFGIIYKS